MWFNTSNTYNIKIKIIFILLVKVIIFYIKLFII